MRYNNHSYDEHGHDGAHRLRQDCRVIAHHQKVPQRQDSMSAQIDDLGVLATTFGLYDAHAWLVAVQNTLRDAVDMLYQIEGRIDTAQESVYRAQTQVSKLTQSTPDA